MKGKAILYSIDELAWLEANSSLPIAQYHEAFVYRFKRPDVLAQHLHALRKRKGWKTGRTGRFERGSIPMNKGHKYGPGEGPHHPNAVRTRFKPGSRQGIAAAIYQPIGTERITRDGYRERKIHDGLPMQSRWRAVHLIEWEAMHGPLPKGMCLKCLDGNKANTDPANWALIPRAMLPRLNGRFGRDFDAAPPELKPLILKTAELEHAAREARKANP